MNHQELIKIANVPPKQRSAFLLKLKRYYCPAIVTLGMCEKPCSEHIFCVRNIQKALDIKNARDPVAVFVWRLRDIVADVKEQEYEKPGLLMSWTGDPVNENPFEALMDRLLRPGPGALKTK